MGRSFDNQGGGLDFYPCDEPFRRVAETNFFSHDNEKRTDFFKFCYQKTQNNCFLGKTYYFFSREDGIKLFFSAKVGNKHFFSKKDLAPLVMK